MITAAGINIESSAKIKHQYISATLEYCVRSYLLLRDILVSLGKTKALVACARHVFLLVSKGH